MNSETDAKRLIVEMGRRLWTRGVVASNDGNISVRLGKNRFLVTPTGVSKGFMSAGMIVTVDENGKRVSRNSRFRPTSEIAMHLEVYAQRPDVRAVVHAHPPFATSFAVAGIPLTRAVLPEAILTIGAVPLAKYGLHSTGEIPDAIRELIRQTDVILLQNHGALSVGANLESAYSKMETLEHTASIIWHALQLGNVNVLSAYERDRIIALREQYGLRGPIIVCDSTPYETDGAVHAPGNHSTNSQA